ncbi:MAG: LysR family transcriptional regulator [Alphaproteobacteria bacterium]|nr:LysR family transcriptional regulator [Alphaproteobacteria bacterium]
MNIAGIQTFLAIVETGSLARAASRLNVTQSTVTTRLKTLEATLGQKLINRSKTGASTTSAGLRLQRYAEAIVGSWRQARLEVATPKGSRKFRNIAVHNDLWVGWGERLFAHIDEGAEVAVSVFMGSDAEITAWMDGNMIDLAVGFGPVPRPDVVADRVGADRLILVSTRLDAPVRFDPGYIYVDYGEFVSGQHMSAYADADAARLTFSAPEPALKFLEAAGGTAYLPQRMVGKELAEGRLFELTEAPVFERPVFLNRRSNVRRPDNVWVPET